jgi:hypothetical protein
LAITTDRGSGTGADGTVVMPAPRCWIRLVAVTKRRVGRVRPARADPIGELDSLVENVGCLVALGAERAETAAEPAAPLLGAGIPQTLQ